VANVVYNFSPAKKLFAGGIIIIINKVLIKVTVNSILTDKNRSANHVAF